MCPYAQAQPPSTQTPHLPLFSWVAPSCHNSSFLAFLSFLSGIGIAFRAIRVQITYRLLPSSTRTITMAGKRPTPAPREGSTASAGTLDIQCTQQPDDRMRTRLLGAQLSF